MKSLFYLCTILLLSTFLSSCGETNKNSDANKYYERAGEFYNQNKLDSSLLMLTLFVNNTNDTLRKGAVYRYMGDMMWNVGDVYAAEEYATGTIKTLDTLNQKHHAELSYAYHLLGNMHTDLKHYDEAIDMYQKAVRFSTDSNFVINLTNGKALALQKKGKYNEAISIYDSLLSLKPANQLLFARIIDNQAKTKWLQNHEYNALPELWHALKIRIDSQDNRGLNASYAHLSDYYIKEKPDSALWYATRMLEQAQIIQTPDDRLEAIDKIIRLDNPLASKQWYNEFKRLNDSAQLSRDTTRNRYAFIRYDSQKSKAENLELRQQRLWLFGLVMVAILITAWIWNNYNKRRKRIKQEAEQAIQQSKLKTSQKVHDVVANGLYRIMNELEHGKTIERDPLLDKIEILYEKSRDISYDKHLSQAEPPDYSKHVHDLLMAFENGQTHVIIKGNDQTFWNRITAHQRNELQLILTEIMVNMNKHSQAKNVDIAFRHDQHTAFITYTDNGIGFTPGQQFGNGLNNTVNRIKSLNGDVIFGESGPGGVRISISWPLQSITS